MSIFRNCAVVLLAAVATLGLSTAPASADPQNGFLVQMSCDDGNSYSVVFQAGADWNAQLDTATTSVFHLTWYEITYVITTPDGTTTVYGPFEVVKGGNDREQKNLLACTYAFDA